MKRFLTADDYIVSLQEIIDGSESYDEIDEINKLEVGQFYDRLMRIADGEHLSSHDDLPNLSFDDLSNLEWKVKSEMDRREEDGKKRNELYIQMAGRGKRSSKEDEV